MAQSKYLTTSPTFDELIFGLSLHLNDLEQQHFHLAYNKYQKERNLTDFVDALLPLFNTGPRRTLINPIRKILKPADVPKYNQLLVRHGLLTTRKPLRMKLQEHYEAKQRAQTLPRNLGSSTPVDGGIKKVTLKRDTLGDLGFSIRGGAEYNLGVFVSWVDAGSAAAKSGLNVGDQILQVNGVSFEGISHSRAVQNLRKSQRLRLVILNSQRFPVAKHGQSRYHWIDPVSGQPTHPPPNSVLDKELLLQDSDVRKVRLETRQSEDLGFSIRGGLEHELGLFIVEVEPNSTAEYVGLLPGDLIIDVNGVDFTNISHRDAISILKSHHVMLITLKHVGKIPVSITSQTGPTEWHRIRQRSNLNVPSATQSLSSPRAKKFIHGYGTQLMHQKQQATTGKQMIEHRAKSLLTEREANTIMYYLNEYHGHGMAVDVFMRDILDILDSQDKLVLLSDIRQVIYPKDMDSFDRHHDKIRNQMQFEMSQSVEDEYYHDNTQFDFIPAPLEASFSSPYSEFDQDMLAALPETSISRSLPDDIADTMTSRRRYLGDNEDLYYDDDDDIMRKPIKRPGLKSSDSINRAKREAEELAKRERLIRETEERVRKETEQRLREEHEIALQRQQGQIEDELKKERDDQLRLEDELDRVKEETEDRVRREVEEEFIYTEEQILSEEREKNRKKLDEIISKRQREEDSHQDMVDKTKRDVERKVKLEMKQKFEEENKILLRRITEENEQKEQEANEGLDAARKRHQEELELVKQEAVEQAKRQAERQAKKKLDEEKRKIEAEAQARKQAEERMFKQEKERIKRIAYENAKKEAESKARVEKEQLRKRQVDAERRRRERLLIEAEREAKAEAAREVTVELEQQDMPVRDEVEVELRDERTIVEDSPLHGQDDYDPIRIQEAETLAREEAVQVAMRKAQPKPQAIPTSTQKERSIPLIDPTKKFTYDSVQISNEKVESGKKSSEGLIEEERDKAEKLLQERMRTYMNQQNKRYNEVRLHEHRSKAKSYNGFTNLYGEIIKVEIKKVAKRLGIAVDGGANTKQKEVKIREIMPGGSAALTGEGLHVGQHILEVNGRILKDLTHKEAVLTIKGAFEADDKVMELVVLEPETSF